MIAVTAGAAALRTLGVPTQLVLYPGQFHLLTRPSYIKDCIQRHLAWFDRYLAPAVPCGARPAK
jgi:dipeptidyl aminopeptidase/acylaminoacyl peptidase